MGERRLRPHATASGYPDRPQIFAESYGYDSDGNRTSKYDVRIGVGYEGNSWDFTYDGLDRLKQANKGTWNGATLTADAGSRLWDLDMLGNWKRLDESLDANFVFAEASIDTFETRENNYANE